MGVPGYKHTAKAKSKMRKAWDKERLAERKRMLKEHPEQCGNNFKKTIYCNENGVCIDLNL
jgi:hypothetical protein